MSDLNHWQQQNDDYLAAALEWLRLRLRRLAGPTMPPVTATPVLQTTPAPRRFFGRQAAPSTVAPIALPAPADTVSDEQIAAAAAILTERERLEPPPALVILSQRFGLSRFEAELLLLCAALELDTSIAGLCARAQNDLGRPYPTFALALTLFDQPAWEALSPERPLRYWRLIEINQPAGQPLTSSSLRADERIINYIKGLNYLDDRLAPLLYPLDSGPGAEYLPPSQQGVVRTIVNYLEQHNGMRLPVIELLGSDSSSKRLIAGSAVAELGLRLFRLPAEVLPQQAGDLEAFARLWQRESVLLPIALYLDAAELERNTTSDGAGAAITRLLGRSDGLFFLDTREVWSGLNRPTLGLDIAKPTPVEQQMAWAAALETVDASTTAQLAGQFNLSLSEIQQIAREARAASPPDQPPSLAPLWEACQRHTRPRLDALAQRLDPRANWEDLVLPDHDLYLLRQIASQVRQRSQVYDEWGFRRRMNRGLGISALFAGESGTGKTMAAEVIANDLRLNLYRIDLSAVVSKYIGETEKNLRKLFDAAEDGGAILFFDEADALFGKRSEVKDSHDRYANIEINYLLQRMEAYGGLAILATNMKNALDTAFMRRLRFIVNFTFPGIAERKLIWRRALPPETPTEGLDFDRLAKITLTGGSIHNIALNAAFLAARAATPVTMPLLLDAARTEYRKLEKPINEADFRY